MSEMTVAVAVVRCTLHGQKAVLVGDTRITPSKCCGSWNYVEYHWPNVTSFDVARALDQFAATPPTPDLDGVVDALVLVLRAAPKQSAYLALALRCDDLNVHRIADALLAAVSRPTPRTETYAHDCGCETCPDHTHRPTPQAAPEVTEAMVEAAIHAHAEWWRTPGEVSPSDRWRYILTAALRAGGTE